VRQEASYQDLAGAAILSGVKGTGDYSIYPSGRYALRWNRKTTSAVTYQQNELELVVHWVNNGTPKTWIAYSESGPPPGQPGGDDFVMEQIDEVGARTDFLKIMYQDWVSGPSYINTADNVWRWDSAIADRYKMVVWTDNAPEFSLPAGADETWNFLTYFKPTNFVDHTDLEVIGRSDDYRTPDNLSISNGGVWSDVSENTGLADDFNESEGAYLLTFDPSLGLVFDIDGAPTIRHSPFFKIRHWRSLRDPETVTLEGVPLTNDVDYKADVKPIARAHWDSCGVGCFTELAHGGLTGHADEFLADGSTNFTLNFTGTNTEHLYLGSDSKFRGLNISLTTKGVGSADLQWEYWDGTTWANLEIGFGFTDETNSLTRDGTVYWTGDPFNWAPTSVNAGPELYYVRAYLASGSYLTAPVERLIKTDILLFQFCGDITSTDQTFAFPVPTTTAVELVSFEAREGDAAVLLEWETGSEVDNVGFYLYRATSESGPYELVNPSVIPGLGSSPRGARYRYVDSGLVNGRTYFYELEDLESTGVRERHGPVSATPMMGASFETPEDAGEEAEGTSLFSGASGVPGITYGEPEQTTLKVLKRSRGQVVLELITSGFYAEPQDDGSVRLSIPGFLEDWEPTTPAIPVKGTWLEAVAGRNVRITSVQARDVQAFSLRPTSADLFEPVMLPAGTVSLARKAQKPGKAYRGSGLYPEKPARVVSIGFQGDVKKAFLELSPLRWDRSSGQLLLASRLIVTVVFKGRVAEELSLGGSRGRRHRNKDDHDERDDVIAHVVTHDDGLYGVSYEALFGNRRQGVKTKQLNLTYQGEPVAFYVEPDDRQFRRGSVLYFVSGGEELNPYGREAVYELSLAGGGLRMSRVAASPSGSAASEYYWRTIRLEENHLFQGRLITAPDIWLWDFLLAPVTKAYPFEVDDLAATTETASLKVWIQGTTDLPAEPDHHVRIYLNGMLVEDFTVEGELAWMGEVELLPGALVEGENLLEIENVGDTGAAYSRIMLNRFEVTYPSQLVADSGQLRGRFGEPGSADVTGLTGHALIVDTTGSIPRWLTEAEVVYGGLRFQAEAGHHYLVADSNAVLTPEIRQPLPLRLQSMLYGANYVVIGPESLLPASWPLLELRQSQGLTALAVPIEQIYSEFGHGESRPEAIRDFLEHAYHHWRTPPRYVVLLGDGTFDFKDYLGWGVENQVPPFPLKSKYLWTASDPAYASINGDDLLPDLAIGRLPAANLEEARVMVEKIVAYEKAGMGLGGRAVLVTDLPDAAAGDFVSHAEELAASLLSGRAVEKIHLDELGALETRDSILQAFDDGASLMSYIGHGGMQLWNHNVLRTDDVEALEYQSQQPLLLTMNCLNGYFQFPLFDSLSETLVKAEGKGAIAAFSPSGQSLDGPAHVYHRLLLAELLHADHQTLGDAILAAQAKFAETSGFPDLLSIYHLFGDPGMRFNRAKTP
jgi:hypothetical protein